MKNTITVHSTNTPPSLNLTGRDVDRRDRKDGYSKCGYHFVIDRAGEVSEHRPLDSASIHDDVDAKEAVSICLVGGFAFFQNKPADTFTLPQWESLKNVIRAVGETCPLTSVRSKTEAVTTDRINQIIWKGNP